MTYDGRRGRPASLHCVYFWFQYRVGRGVGVGGGVHGIGSVSIFSSGGVFRVPADRGELRGPPRRELFFPKLFFSNTQTFMPCLAKMYAVHKPPKPLPIIIASYFAIKSYPKYKQKLQNIAHLTIQK